ncbi:PAS domain S-box-containing protein/diguanylate cyclase (GGDEF) domain-containing protein [Terribacillus aidingensis]|uniref:PAS domain S-box-containing protein/diguanylate cyclase (GGDEF) domain-containing protein n=1 Tax=Terribacillus aidingensis TaxID=586416 RepID=A0A285N2M4_9BACI|nr:GGDEF and EAL domain-containing protein [Terribacillus aidingensis]SNZ03680.1 PAS domain S-box-containing protein/diguanylate cyclase (GGDEF) domain-containing protein [Terribacillus aidingensis]
MFSFIDIPGIHLIYTIFSVLLLSVLTSVVLYVSQHMMRTVVTARKVVMVSSLAGVSGTLATFLFILSIDANQLKQASALFFLSIFLVSTMGGAITLRMIRIPIENTQYNLLLSILLAFIIYALHIFTPFALYADRIHINPAEVIVTIALTQSTVFSMFRFLNMYTHRRQIKWSKFTLLAGSFMTGVGIVGLGYSIFAAFVSSPSAEDERLLFLLPVGIVLFINIFLTVIPLFYRNRTLLTMHQLYQSLFDDNPYAVFAVEADNTIQHANKKSAHLTGFDNDSIPCLDAASLFPDKETFQKNLALLKSGSPQQWDTKLVQRSGEQIDVHVTGIPTIIRKQVVGYFLVMNDTSQTKETAKQIQFLAYHDDLTRLPNRRLMQQTMQRYTKKHKPFSIMLIDYDLFKRINDIFGHSFGDEVLMETADRLTRILDGSGTVHRVGGDEFLLIIPGKPATQIAQSIVKKFQQPMRIQEYELVLQASIGIASYPADAEDMDNLYKYADIAMYQTKENGGNSYTVFQQEMAEKQVLRFEIEHELQKAIETQAFDLYFQPKFHSFKRNITGAEVLLRWNHPERGFIPPNVFIPIAEESGLIVEIERSVIERVMACLADWDHAAESAIPRISINVSVSTFLQDDFSAFFCDRLQHYNISGCLLELEITERVVMQNETKINMILQQLRETGVRISIDDFGTGYSSLSYLDKLKVDILKIDQTFIQHIQHNQTIVAAIQSLADNLQLHTIAEGVETEEQLQKIRSLGCTEVQGYLFSKPLPQADFEASYIEQIPAGH